MQSENHNLRPLTLAVRYNEGFLGLLKSVKGSLSFVDGVLRFTSDNDEILLEVATQDVKSITRLDIALPSPYGVIRLSSLLSIRVEAADGTISKMKFSILGYPDRTRNFEKVYKRWLDNAKVLNIVVRDCTLLYESLFVLGVFGLGFATYLLTS